MSTRARHVGQATAADPTAPRRLQLSIDSDLRHVALVGSAIKRLSAMAGFSDSDCSQIALCVAEAANNSIRHAYANESGHEVRVRFSLEADRIVLAVTDWGSSMGQLEVPALEFDPGEPASLPEGGMGLFIIHSVMDNLGYESRDGCNTLTMTKLLRDRS